MKRIIAVGMALLMMVGALSLTSCNKEEPYSNPYSALTLEEIAACLEFADSYKGIAIKQSDIDDAMENDYESTKKSLLSGYAEDLKEGVKLKDGDTASIEYSGILEGETEPFEGGTGSTDKLVLGSGTMIEGFEEGIVGATLNEKLTLNLTFPKDYKDAKKYPEEAKKFNGKKVTFTVTVKGGKVLPVFNDEFIKKAFKDNEDSFYKYETVAEYEAAAVKQIYANLAFAAYKNATKATKFPQELLEKEYDSLVKQYKTTANAYGYTLEAFISIYGYKTVEDFSKAMTSQAAASVKNSLLLYYVYNTNKSEIDGMVEANKDRILYDYSESVGLSVEEIYEEVEEQAINDLVINALISEFLGAQCTVTDDVVTPTPTPTVTETPAATVTPTATETAAE
ncbi:MAG: hypothetical protein E7675_03360 [Ruminococcaceae bacterium]|nr:hypothetical protein [Oscillospiraceae bacterium]